MTEPEVEHIIDLRDPDSLLAEIRRVSERIRRCQEDTRPAEAVRALQVDLAIRLGGLVDELDRWITGGGYLPRGWTRL
jgi:hypothetical protein